MTYLFGIGMFVTVILGLIIIKCTYALWLNPFDTVKYSSVKDSIYYRPSTPSVLPNFLKFLRHYFAVVNNLFDEYKEYTAVNFFMYPHNLDMYFMERDLYFKDRAKYRAQKRTVEDIEDIQDPTPKEYTLILMLTYEHMVVEVMRMFKRHFNALNLDFSTLFFKETIYYKFQLLGDVNIIKNNLMKLEEHFSNQIIFESIMNYYNTYNSNYRVDMYTLI
jgi:hypothetical protein